MSLLIMNFLKKSGQKCIVKRLILQEKKKTTLRKMQIIYLMKNFYLDIERTFKQTTQ